MKIGTSYDFWALGYFQKRFHYFSFKALSFPFKALLFIFSKCESALFNSFSKTYSASALISWCEAHNFLIIL
jgi:hypothetical protein